ncbi:putative BAP31 domain protein [Aspergillus homomorphus CBS 101889]|uniref:Endoplasmic reticulum transmembrane protein n=1 Tax=Aspergillus homomorphus (strain CBS 101889) TaxID=1450537 RepID=A0A395IBZ8_ASPHC|nr:B-cell receptor-associated 31-like protein [Aspergillus homomorphus CBS 101889]RAL16673.1 B-cell receptor-associated 31-like protein [Aspergillus homomorphus CBS 101889]
MTLYYSLVFCLLVFEMVVFMGLIIPLPFTVKRKLFAFISESPIVAKLQYGLKITFIFILILFIDSVNRVYRVQLELASFKEGGPMGAAALGTDRMEVQARKFYSQRNMYLCGFTLFLSLILNRTYTMILEVLRLEDRVKLLEGDKRAGGKDSARLAQAGEVGEIGRLKQELEAKDRDIETLKKQCENLTAEYHRLGDQVSGDNKDAAPKKDL